MISMVFPMVNSMVSLIKFGKEEQLKLLQLDKSGIKVAQYMTNLPSNELIQRQLHKGLEAARQRWENHIDD